MMNTELAQRLKEIQDSQQELQEQSMEVRRLMEKQKNLEELLDHRKHIEHEICALEEDANKAESEIQKKTIELEVARRRDQLNQVIAHQNELEKELLAMTFIIQKNKKFDKSILFRNIRELLKNSDVKLGQIEREAGCQAGYMSRLEKAGNTSDPSVEFVVTAAKLLNVSVDLLINADVGTITPTEEYMLEFLNTMIEDTRTDSLTWKRETQTQLEHVEPNFDSAGTTSHPLFLYQRLWATEEEYEDDIFYNSHFYPRETVRIVANCYNAELGGTGAKIYIMVCKKGIAREQIDLPVYYELYLIKNEIEPICCTLQTCGAVTETVEALYKEIEVASTHVHLGANARSIIGEYFEERKLPF